jgi:hypothetical protein
MSQVGLETWGWVGKKYGRFEFFFFELG